MGTSIKIKINQAFPAFPVKTIGIQHEYTHGPYEWKGQVSCTYIFSDTAQWGHPPWQTRESMKSMVSLDDLKHKAEQKRRWTEWCLQPKSAAGFWDLQPHGLWHWGDGPGHCQIAESLGGKKEDIETTRARLQGIVVVVVVVVVGVVVVPEAAVGHALLQV